MPRDQVFISYSHKDREWLERLQRMLKPLVRKNSISVWDDTKINAGAGWKEEIERALGAAKAAVLLVTDNFLDSDFIAEHELPPLLESAKKEGLVILWVYVSSCLYDETEIKDYQAAHNISKPLASLRRHTQNAALADICRNIKAAANQAKEPPWQNSELFVPRYDVNLDKMTQDFCGRGWLFDKIKDWTSTAPGLLLLGDPGTGKSAIMAELVKFNKLPILAYHFFNACKRDTLRPAAFIHDLVARIAKRCPEYKKWLEERAASKATLVSEEEWDKNPSSYIDRLFLQPPGDPCKLSSLYNLSKEGPQYILLDALDEAVSSGHDYEESLLRGLQGLLRTDLPDQLRIIATSRREPKVTNQLHFHVTVDINSKEDYIDNNVSKHWTRKDLETYITNRLNQSPLSDMLSRSPKPISANDVTHLLSDKADGNFLYAAQALLWLELDGNFSLEDLNALPSELESLYYKFCKRQFKGEDYAPVRKLLEVLVAAQEPLTEDQLSSATGLGSNRLSSVLKCVEAYLSKEQDKKYKLYHKSFRDWLTSSKLKGEPYYIDPRKGHEQLADFCWDDYEHAIQPRPRRPRLYTLRYGVRHLIEVQRYAQAVDLLYWLLNEGNDLLRDSSELVSRLRLFAKVISIALTEHAPGQDEAQKINPDKLAFLLRPLYMTEALYGGIDLLVGYHPEAWPKIFKDFIGTQDYVLRYTISEALGEAYRVKKDPKRLDEICRLVENNDIGYQEVGYHALRFIIAKKPQLLRDDKYVTYMRRLADFPTYPGRSILGDLLLNLMLQNKERDTSLRPERIMKLVDRSSRFWNPIWRFQQMDVWAIDASNNFVLGESLSDAASDGVRSAYKILKETEERKTQLLDAVEKDMSRRRTRRMENVSSLLKSYYQLGIKTNEEIRAALSDLKDKDNSSLIAVFEVLFAYPLWEVVEKAASVLASIVDDNPRAVEVIMELFANDIWRVRYGAAETAFLVTFDKNRKLFCDAVKRFYKEDEPLLRGNCAENVAAWILETEDEDERADLLDRFREEIAFWLKDEDCWVLDHMYRLFGKLPKEIESLRVSGVSHLLEGESGVWYQLDRKDFLERIEENRLARPPG